MLRLGARTLWLLGMLEAPLVAMPAEAAGPRSVDLGEALAYARAHQPTARAAEARIAASDAAAAVPRAAWLPRFGATAQLFAATANQTTASTLSVDLPDLPRIGGTRATSRGTFRPYPSTLLGVGGTQELYDFGRIGADGAAADALARVERARADAEDLELAFDVEEAYFSVLAAKAVLRASEDAYTRATVHRDLARAGVTSGLRAPIELTRAESELAKLDIGRIRAQGDVKTAQALLAAAIGAEEPAVDARSDVKEPDSSPALAEAVARAAERHPDVVEALARLEAQRAETRAVSAEDRPDLFATASLTGRAGGAPPSGNGIPADGDGFVPNVPNWDVGVVLTVPLFDPIVGRRKRAALARERVAEEEVRVVRERTLSALRTAYVAVEVARDALPGLRHAEAAARDNYAQADARFKAGLGTSVELADAESLRAGAEIQTALGEFELHRSRAALGRAIAEGR